MAKNLNDRLETMYPISMRSPGILYRARERIVETGRSVVERTGRTYQTAKSKIYSLLENDSDQIIG